MSRRLIGGEDFDQEEVERTETHLDKLMLHRHGKTQQHVSTHTKKMNNATTTAL